MKVAGFDLGKVYKEDLEQRAQDDELERRINSLYEEQLFEESDDRLYDPDYNIQELDGYAIPQL